MKNGTVNMLFQSLFGFLCGQVFYTLQIEVKFGKFKKQKIEIMYWLYCY
jgi:hypothetical protein